MKEDRGYDSKLASRATIYFNGEPIDLCLTADDELGYVLCYVMDGGRLKLDERREPVTQELWGRVVIELHGTRPGVVAPYPES
jgi:hypothetical protein